MQGSPQEGNKKLRHRASVACSACRDRRTRCVVPEGETSCTQCRDTGQECIIKHDDQRRKPVSKAYVSMLEDRISQLETALRQKEEQAIPTAPVSHVPEQSLASSTNNTTSFQRPEMTFNFAIPSIPEHDNTNDYPQHTSPRLSSDSPNSSTPSSNSTTSSRKYSMVHKLVSTKGHLSYDPLAGRLRYFGPTTNCHIYSELVGEAESNRPNQEQDRRTQRVLSTLSLDTHDYLISCYWRHYNTVIPVVHQEAFEEGQMAGGGQFYSGFLHICILAAGFRFADKARPDIMRIMSPSTRESSLHREAKYMLDYELERPGGISLIGALLLLGDLEVGCGRDNVGWLYSGMANRLCFDIGLHLDVTDLGLPQREMDIRRMTLSACVVYDRYWALFLGRPTALKLDDLEVYQLSEQFNTLGTSPTSTPPKPLEMQIYEALMELMELSGKITEIMNKVAKRNPTLDHHVYIRMSALDRELEAWYMQLPRALQYTTENVQSAPLSFFLLHQQYYSTMILLHRQFAHYEELMEDEPNSLLNGDSSSHFSARSRATCTTSAGRMAQIFWQHRQRFDSRRLFVTGLQHAGNAASALVAAIASSSDQSASNTNMKYLECLTAALEDMSETYKPAEQMAAVLHAVLAELRSSQPESKPASLIPARRGSSADRESEPDFIPSKRGQSNRRNTKPTMTHLSATDGFVVVSGDGNDLPTFDDAWSKLGAHDHIPIDPDLGFRSVWAGAETPSFSPLPTTEAAARQTHLPGASDTTDMGFMSLLNEPAVLVGDEIRAVHAGLSDSFKSVPTPGTPGGSNASLAKETRRFRSNKARRESIARYSDRSNQADDIWSEMLR
ncbi:fungal-specific transcription factor domain-containing protein [Aspergillus floccosus]